MDNKWITSESSNNEVRELLSKLNSDLVRLPYDEIKKTLNPIFTALPKIFVEFTNDKFFFNQRDYNGKNVIYRSRININNNDKPYDNVSEFSYIPPENLGTINNWGRINKPYESMFYGSFKLLAACHEIASYLNCFNEYNECYLTVGVWEFTSPLKFVEIPPSEVNINLLYSKFKDIPELFSLKDKIKEQLLFLKSFYKFNIDYELLQYFSQSFTMIPENDDDNIYKLSNYYADRIFNKMQGCRKEDNYDGIIYPSLVNCYQEKNLVLPPNVVDEGLKFVEAISAVLVRNVDDTCSWGSRLFPIKYRVKPDSNGLLDWDNFIANNGYQSQWENYLKHERKLKE